MEDSAVVFSGSGSESLFSRSRISGAFSGVGSAQVSHRSNPGVEATLLAARRVGSFVLVAECSVLRSKPRRKALDFRLFPEPYESRLLGSAVRRSVVEARLLLGVQGSSPGFPLVGTRSTHLSGIRGSESCLEVEGNNTGIFFSNRLCSDDLVSLGSTQVGTHSCWGKIFHEEITPASVFQVSAPRVRVHASGSRVPVPESGTFLRLPGQVLFVRSFPFPGRKQGPGTELKVPSGGDPGNPFTRDPGI
ncbi:hypothetical protein F2Q68_00009775 [Brassica cretica]|uniref:Uncharacterized protein n=1 Tax=Brassica cretica TaxID=69181 RepID=A0A8S9L148_BRACR|nr:hypothetical protein F2Q68_00009775 [Brassica cretica]